MSHAVSPPIPVVTVDGNSPQTAKGLQEQPSSAVVPTVMEIDLVNEDDQHVIPAAKDAVTTTATTPSTTKTGKAPKTQALIQEKKSKKPEKAAKESAPPSKTLLSFFAKNA